MPDAIYLRKSRADLEMESRSAVDVLARHEEELRRNAARLGRTITAVYREVVSGDTISARPEMMKLLHEVEAGMWDAVHVVETSRLARGDTIDQGIVARAFSLSNTLIITPAKVVDPNNEFDSDFFEFDLFMARREYKMITRRMQRGRMASTREGKWAGNRAPFGYDRRKLEREKGWTLNPNADAETVKDIFHAYTEEGLGVSRIVRRLNETGILSPKGQDWTNCAVREILSNPAYAGFVRWGFRPTVKTVENGEVKLHNPRRKDYELFPGLHPALISKETFDAAQSKLAQNKSRPGPKQVETKNPLSGLVICSKCGRAMVRRPYGNGYPDGLLCIYTSCDTVSSTLSTVEEAIFAALRKWLVDLDAGVRPEETTEAAELSAAEKAESAAEKDLEDLGRQLNRIYDLTEQGVYSSEDFLTRSRENAARRKDTEERLAALRQRAEDLRSILYNRQTLAPDLRHVLDAYPSSTPAEKNALLKSVLSKVVYSKTSRERWGNGSDMHIDLFPRLPSKYSH